MNSNIEIRNNFNFNNLFINILIKTEKNDKIIENNTLSDVKNKITKYSKDKKWDFYKKITNPYELIYLTKKLDKPFSISKYEPISPVIPPNKWTGPPPAKSLTCNLYNQPLVSKIQCAGIQ